MSRLEPPSTLIDSVVPAAKGRTFAGPAMSHSSGKTSSRISITSDCSFMQTPFTGRDGGRRGVVAAGSHRGSRRSHQSDGLPRIRRVESTFPHPGSRPPKTECLTRSQRSQQSRFGRLTVHSTSKSKEISHRGHRGHGGNPVQFLRVPCELCESHFSFETDECT